MYIYCATNSVNGKKYIGKWCNTWQLLLYRHKRAARNNAPQAVYRAIRKYGWDAFVWNVLWEGSVTLAELSQLEIKWISALNTMLPHGYNMTKGGEGGTPFTSESKRIKCGNIFRGKKHTAEAREKIKQARSRQVISSETKKKIGDATRGKTYEERYGIEKATELRKKRSASLKGRPKTAAHVENMRKALIGKRTGKRGRYKCELQDSAIVRLRKSGMTQAKIAELAGVSVACIKVILKENKGAM